VRVYSELVAIGNRPVVTEAQRGESLDAARRLCTTRYLATRPLSLGPEGGIAGLPRTVHPRFQAWREGPNVWICPTNRLGPVYQFVNEDGQWRFDGLIAVFMPPRGELVRASDLPELDL
jgi:hypothetical protein